MKGESGQQGKWSFWERVLQHAHANVRRWEWAWPFREMLGVIGSCQPGSFTPTSIPLPCSEPVVSPDLEHENITRGASLKYSARRMPVQPGTWNICRKFPPPWTHPSSEITVSGEQCSSVEGSQRPITIFQPPARTPPSCSWGILLQGRKRGIHLLLVSVFLWYKVNCWHNSC